MQSEFQLQYIGKCRECGTNCYYDPDEDRNVWTPDNLDCLHKLRAPIEDMWRIICRHGITPSEIEVFKLDILADGGIENPDEYEAIVFATGLDNYMVKVVEASHAAS